MNLILLTTVVVANNITMLRHINNLLSTLAKCGFSVRQQKLLEYMEAGQIVLSPHFYITIRENGLQFAMAHNDEIIEETRITCDDNTNLTEYVQNIICFIYNDFIIIREVLIALQSVMIFDITDGIRAKGGSEYRFSTSAGPLTVLHDNSFIVIISNIRQNSINTCGKVVNTTVLQCCIESVFKK